MNSSNGSFDFQRKAREEMIHEGFVPDFPAQVLAETQSFKPAPIAGSAKDLRSLLWSSIDNTESRDLDQIEWAERLPNDSIRVLVGVADVDSIVKKGSVTDTHAQVNATSVYTGGPVFPMLPERLSTDLTSLGPNADRRAMVMEFIVGSDGHVDCSDVCLALVRNQAQLNYDQVGSWLESRSPDAATAPFKLAGLGAQLLLQHEASRRLMTFRRLNG